MASTLAHTPATSRKFAPLHYTTRFPALDGIRALAVTMVFLVHFGGGAHGGRVLQVVDIARRRFSAGVDIFFVLSGFLITGILFDTLHDSHFFKRFYVRRSVRIFPVFFLLFAVLGILTPILNYHWQWRQAWFLLYVGNFFANSDWSLYGLPSGRSPIWDATFKHLWSLCVEEQFYVLWPLLVWLVRDRVKLLWLSFSLAGVILLLRVWAVLAWTPEMAEHWTLRALPFRGDGLLLGAALALLLRGPAADTIQRASKWLLLGGLVATLTIWFRSPSFFSPWTLSLGQTTIAIFSMGLIGVTLRANSLPSRIFSLWPARVLGRYSYGFYVWHVVWQMAWIQLLSRMVQWTHSTALAGLIVLPLGFATSFLMAKVSYDLFEVRFLGIKRRFEYDSEIRRHKTAFAPDGR